MGAERLEIMQEDIGLDIYQIGFSLPKERVPQKVRQNNDFSLVLKGTAPMAKAPHSQTQLGGLEADSQTEVKKGGEQALVSLGKLSRPHTTVSNLLIHHPIYKKDCWRIVHSDINHLKPFTKIRPETEIFLDTRTGEILWGKMLKTSKESLALATAESPQQKAELIKPDATAQPEKEKNKGKTPNSLSERLVGAIEPFMGKTYKKMNCYELLVNGLTNLGYQYSGAGGLGRKLMAMAREKGLPMNAYFNGEGIIEASGTPVYAKSLLRVRSPEAEADKMLKEMEPLLEKGQILAFSIHTKGHTGIISRTANAWTYINSGRMDNSMESTNQAKGVGEESLKAELRHWFDLAKTRGESLRITLGRLNEQKLVAFTKPSPTIREEA